MPRDRRRFNARQAGDVTDRVPVGPTCPLKSSRCFQDPPVGVGLARGADLHAVGTSHSNFKLEPNAILTMPLGSSILTFGPNAKYANGVGEHALATNRRYLAACPRRHLLVRRHPLRAFCPGPDRDVAAAANP